MSLQLLFDITQYFAEGPNVRFQFGRNTAAENGSGERKGRHWDGIVDDPVSNLTERIELFRDVKGLGDTDVSNKCSWQRYSKNSPILHKDDLTSDIFFIVEGAVTARSYSAEGKEVSYIDIDQGGLFGEFSAIDGKPRSASVETTKDAVIARMTSAQFRSLITEHPHLGLKIAELLVSKTRSLTQRVHEFGTLSVRERLVNELLRLCENTEIVNGECTIEPAPTHYEIASRIATHREAVSRELNALVTAGIIEVGRQKIVVRDMERLRNLAN